jgi:hypothetical protein
MPAVDEVRPARCPCCGSGSRPCGQGLRLHGHGLRERQMLGPREALGEPVAVEVSCRRYLCLICDAVVLVVPGEMLPRRYYSSSAIAQALALFGLERKSLAEIRRRTSPFHIVGVAASSEWATFRRWCDDVRSSRLFSVVRGCPGTFTRRQVAERAATTIGSRAPPPVDASLTVRAFVGATRAA